MLSEACGLLFLSHFPLLPLIPLHENMVAVRRRSFLDAMEAVKEQEEELLTQLDGFDRSLTKEDLNFGESLPTYLPSHLPHRPPSPHLTHRTNLYPRSAYLFPIALAALWDLLAENDKGRATSPEEPKYSSWVYQGNVRRAKTFTSADMYARTWSDPLSQRSAPRRFIKQDCA